MPPETTGASVAATETCVASAVGSSTVCVPPPPHAVNKSPINMMMDNPLNKLFFIFYFSLMELQSDLLIRLPFEILSWSGFEPTHN
jgi:hypothetical protein